MKAVAVIQARMTSSRFPGKVLRPLAGRPLLWHIVTRVARAAAVQQVVVACSTRAEDDALARFCAESGVPCIRGSETDVLDRFRLAAQAFPAEIYVRICGDSPLVAPDWIDRCVRALAAASADFARVEPGKRCVHEGVDVLSAEVLARLVREVSSDPVAREHVTGYFKVNPSFARAVDVRVEPGEEGEARLSVDVPEDLEFFARLYAASGAGPGDLDVATALAILRAQPDLRRINAGVRQRQAGDRPVTVFLYGEGGGAVGWGHLSRLAVLAGALRRAGANPVIGYEGGADVHDFFQRANLSSRALPEGAARGDWLARQISATRAHVVLIDTCGRLTATDVAAVRTAGVPVLLLDDTSERVRSADAVYNPPAPQAAEPPAGYTGEWHAGWDAVPLREDFVTEFPPAAGRTLLVTMGGSDPCDFTARAVRALAGLPELAEWRVRIVLGASYRGREGLERLLAELPLAAELVVSTSHMAREMASARAVLLSFGVTAYEAAAAGRPMACFCLSDDHRRHASIFVRHGFAAVLGDDPAGDVATLRSWLSQLDAPVDRTPVMALRQGTTRLVQAMLRWAAPVAAGAAA
ncbi:MAG TPA: NTP transferase domain-containing protein [Lacunisphaera sp.]|nr:NTP transferase domain-containing protein [Lacunisphaera sp.]